MLTNTNGHISEHILPLELIQSDLHYLDDLSVHYLDDLSWRVLPKFYLVRQKNSFNCLSQMREVKAKRILHFGCANLRLSKNQYCANSNTSKVVIILIDILQTFFHCDIVHAL